jgi:tetratricopeptide (TPR) repeat protein
MNVGFGVVIRGPQVAGCVCLAAALTFAQNAAAQSSAKPSPNSLVRASSNTPAGTRALLAGKAHALESRGRPDLSIQLWQQILLSDPNNVEALAGLARDLKLTGSDKAVDALDRLRKASPNSPDIAKIESLASTRAENAQLRQAGELAKQGKVEEAMRLFKQLYGDHPPDGDIAMAYYQTLYGAANGKQEAIAGMRALSVRNPGDPRFAVELGIMLTYDQHTRADGIRILREHPSDSSAQAALRQALVWDSANPSSAGELREYLKQHPQDTELSGRLKEDEDKLAQMNSGMAHTPAERAAFAALNAKHLEEAEKRFTAILDEDPNNGRVAAGMGFLRMQQNNFGEAITYLERAETNGFKDRTVFSGLATSHFWFVMGEASAAFDQNQFDEASTKYREALKMRPRSPEALNGLAGLLTKQQQYAGAALIYDQLVKAKPGSADGWRGLFLAYARDNQSQKALNVEARFPASVKAALNKDPDYLRTLAGIYQAENRTADAQRVLAQALALPFPENGANLKADTKAEYAGILMQAKRYDQAIALYAQMLTEDAGSVSAWEGLVSAEHEMGQDTAALAEVQKMPPAVYETALADAGFLSMLGAIYQQANQFEVAQGLLERSAKLQLASGGQPSIALQLQLAGIYLQENDTARAYGIYHQVLQTNPDRVDAWKGLIASLSATHRENEALQEIAQIPAPVRKELDADNEFIQTEASLYAATGDTAHAIEFMNRVQAHYANLHTAEPAGLEIQNAWLLFNTNNDRALYPALMRLGTRADLTNPQRETVQDIWANWSVRRASAAMENGNLQRSVDILDAASQAFPENLTVRKAVAGGYVQVGRAKESLVLFKTIPMQDASTGDFQGAIGAALAANDKSQAEQWLRQALERFPRDPAILALAARYEQARGDNQRAADYYRASLAAMPSASPTEKLAHVLVYPEQDTRVRKAVTAADLQHLLDPNYEPFAKTTKVPALPAYGPDPYNGSAPVVIYPRSAPSQPPAAQPSYDLGPPNQSSLTGQNQLQIYPPPANRGQSTPAPVYVPQAWLRTSHRPSIWLDAQSRGRRVRRSNAEPHLVYTTLQIDRRDQIGRHERFQWAQRMNPTGPGLKSVGFRLKGAGFSPQMNPALVTQASAPERALSPASPATSQVQNSQNVQLSANPPHSQASDAWKGLVFSLMASSRNAEALDEIAKIPPDIRQQLEADVDFVQGEASLYVAVGDLPHATEYVNRVETFYAMRRADVPPGLEVQHAWLLYNLADDHALYLVLERLDARADLGPALRGQVETLWANFAVRRAEYFLNNGNKLRGVQLLQAASEDYPNNLGVRRAVAGAYAQVGRAPDALALFKTIPMDGASSGDYQGAIGAAISATDMAQAEDWLRKALNRFPNDPQILALAARFEQARGNTARAADFWRASLAAMPPGASAARLDSGLVASSSYTPPVAGDMKHLLDPRSDPTARSSSAPALPAYGPNNSITHTPGTLPPPVLSPQAQPGSNLQPSSTTLPLPAPVYNPSGQTSAPTGSPIFSQQGSVQAEPQAEPKSRASSLPLPWPGDEAPASTSSQPLTASATSPAAVPPHSSAIHTGNRVPTPQLHNPAKAKPPASDLSPYQGKMNLPPSEETVDSTGTVAPPALASGAPSLPPVWTSNSPVASPSPELGLRITSRPMGPVAAQAQALIADQTDAQLTEGSANAIHNVPNAPVGAPASVQSDSPALTQYRAAQYTPSAQEAATGAYSSPKQQQAQGQQSQQQSGPTPPSDIPAPAVPENCTTTVKCKPAKPAARHTVKIKPRPQKTPTPQQAPVEPPANVYQQPDQAAPEQPLPTPAPTTDTGLTDDELQQRNLPPLRGPWVRVQRQPNPINPRDEAEMQLHSIEAGYSPWFGGNGVINYRTGSLGYDHLAALEAPFELSTPLGYNARLTIVARPVFLDSGQADGTSVITVQESTTAGTQLVTIPQPIGTLTATATTLPAQQNAVGIGGEVQLAFPHLAIAGGYTPAGFLVATFTGRAYWKPANGPFTFNFSRDPVRDTQLSYSGLRDPSGDTLGNLGQVWGGVVANQGQVQFAKGDAESGFYVGGGGQYLSGYSVETNTRVDGSGGAYWRLKTMPEYGNLSIGVNFFGMHYDHNEDAFTHGLGGYFSPQAYFLGNVPFTWAAHYGTRWHYNILGSLGVQAFQEDLSPLWPLAVDKSLETSFNNAMLPAKTSVGPNYDLRSTVSYQIGSHWFAGGFLGANNSRNYTSVNAGFSIHYLFRVQPSTATTPTGLFPVDGVRPFTVP